MPTTYLTIPIEECHDPLVAIPAQAFAFTTPHPYVALGAPYGAATPWLLRRRVLDALHAAQDALTARQPGWRLKLFDAWRPLEVQAFMVWREFQRQAQRSGHHLTGLAAPHELQAQAPDVYALLAARVFEFWGMPSDDPTRPPPASVATSTNGGTSRSATRCGRARGEAVAIYGRAGQRED